MVSLSHCAALVRAHDHDRYICTLFAPAAVREAWFTLFAFNHEIASIPESTSEDLLRLMRFAWWREALEEIYESKPVRRHPVALALAGIIGAHCLPRPLLEGIMDAREAMLGRNIADEPARWESYFYATSSALLTLCALAGGLTPHPAIDNLGVAWACAGTARSVPGHENAALLLRTARARLAESPANNLPEIFNAFKDMANFYVKRASAGKPTGRHTNFLCVLQLCLRRMLPGRRAARQRPHTGSRPVLPTEK